MNKLFIHIGARKNSKGVKNKNIKIINGKPLIYWTIKHAKQIKNAYKIIVNTDSNKIIELSKKMNVDITIKRPKNISTSNSSKLSSWKFVVNYLKNNNLMFDDDIFLDFDCTTPSKNLDDTIKMINTFKKFKKLNKKFDGIFTITKAKKNPYFNLVETNKKGYLKLSKKIKKKIIRRQDAPDVYEHAANTYVLKPNFILKAKTFMSGNLLGFKISEKNSWDIDSDFDFKIAQYLMRENF